MQPRINLITLGVADLQRSTDPDGFFWELAHVPQFWIGPGEHES
jgi:hypothetical protein